MTKREKKMKHIMIDLETLGTGVDAVFIAIGAVYFDPDTGELGDEFYENIDWQSSLDAGRKIDADTVKWWFAQSDEARNAILRDGGFLLRVLSTFDHFCGNYPMVWGNGSSFDISMLEHAYREAKIEAPWKFWNVRDVRTIKDLGMKKINKSIFIHAEGTAHNALDDAKHQARYVSVLWQAIKKED
jgi:hypothetical protein